MLTIQVNALFLAALLACFYTTGIIFCISLAIVVIFACKYLHDMMEGYISHGWLD